ncbi:TonB-dependent receptor [Solimonas terrae]|uniref:TonB-dependent receptor n=1 Tax=Solimonas terrae TaxID=1396819 RepID=A0A6M2BTD9_9GAMM|nr:TonB-dependent receptor [Solimonas terrae]NGY05485.1 TonB-dependent receptor [Solimonas terrae]
MSTESRLALAFALSAALPAALPTMAWAQDQTAGDSVDVPVASDGAAGAAPADDATGASSTADPSQAPAGADATADAAAPEPYPGTLAVGNDEPPPVDAGKAAPAGNRLMAEVIVTAQKREENIQKVPISITAFSADALDAKGIDDAKGLAQATPGMYYGQTVNFAVIYIRGVGSDAFLPDSDPSIATYIDGIYYPFANGLSQAFGAVERVEVLKGPQGTLFGRNSTGGAINTVTKSPGPDFESSLLASYASYNDMKLRGYVNIPIVDSLAASLSVVHNEEDSYYKGTIDNPATPLNLGGDASTARSLPGTTENAARVKLKWDILDNLDFNIAGFVDLTQGLSSSAMPNVDPSLIQKSLDTLYGVTTVQPGTYRTDVDVPGYFRSNNKVVYGQFNYRPDWLDVKLLGSHQKIVADNYFDFDGTRVPFIEFGAPGQFADVTTGELQLVSKKDGMLPDWLDGIVGLYYFKEKSGFPDNRLSVLGGLSNGQIAGIPLPSALTGLLTGGGPLANLLNTLTDGLGLPNGGVPNGVDVSLHDQLGTKSWAAYTQETVHFNDSFSFTAGVRYQQEQRHVIQSDVLLINTDGSEAPLLSFNTPSKKSHDLSPKFVLDYNFTKDVMTYLSWTKGYKSGTFKTVNVYTQPQYVKPETVETTELGIKSTFLDGALRFNAAAFQNKIHDMQVQFISVLGGGVAQLENAPGARIRGAEFDTQWTPLRTLDPGLVVAGGLTYLHGIFTSYPQGSGYGLTDGIFFGRLPGGINTGQDFTGNKITRTPKLSGSFGLNQIIDGIGNGNIELAADLYYNSGFYYLAQNSPTSKQDSYYVVNASVSYLYEPWHFRTTVFGKNLTDERYTYSKFILDTGTLEYLAPPRTFGIRLGLDF